MVGSDPKRLLPASLSLGATFLLVADALAKSIWSYEIPVEF
jgi:ABC-type Fe3+-siderophore transport system permease subunit